MELLKKENILIIVALFCLALYFYGKQINHSENAQEAVKFLPVLGGLAYGFNTLINLAK